jgi:hypothetical protein
MARLTYVTSLLYYTTVILAHRPFWSVATYYEVCVGAARAIEKLVLLLESTFGLDNITYLMGYCIYTGASVVLEDAKSSGQGVGHPVLRTFLRALNAGMRRCPLLERSLNIIVKGLNRSAPERREAPPAARANGSDQDATPVPGGAAGGVHLNPYIPAFPYLDPPMPFDFSMDACLNEHNINSMAVLDCFPEMQLDAGDLLCPL